MGSDVIPSNAVCHQGSVPSLMINIQTKDTLVNDIMAAYRFANETKMPLVIKNTGHDWKGRSAAPDSLALWTHNLQDAAFPIELDKSFIPLGCNQTPEQVFHYGPGQQWGGAYDFAHDHNLTVVGGTCGSVGVAGWIHGGGHSPLTPVFGMGADNLREIEIVTPEQGKIIATECHNEDLFFAVRGGGGGTYGVVTKITYKALPKSPIQVFKFSGLKLDESETQQFLNIITSHTVQWAMNGWGGYMKFHKLGHIFEMVNPKLSAEDAERDMGDVVQFILQKGFPSANITSKTQDSWWNFINETMRPPSQHVAMWSMNTGSRLISKSAFEGKTRNDLINAMMQPYKDDIYVWAMMVAPTAFPHTNTSALHPSWKDAIMSIRISDKWDQFDENARRTIPSSSHFMKLHDNLRGVRELAPAMGISISEADIWEENPEMHFWGKNNYEKLLGVKNRSDPHNILSNYGAVNWNRQDIRYGCYPRP